MISNKLPDNSKKILRGYVRNKRFGAYYIPVKWQNQLLRAYCYERKITYSLPIAEPTFAKNHIGLKTLITQTKKNEGIIFLSVHLLPENKKELKIILKKIMKKNIECHFLFENIIVKKNKDLKKIEDFFRLKRIFS